MFALAAFAALPSAAGAAYGDLTFASCLDDDVADECTNLGAQNLQSVQDVAVSPDGRSVYAASLAGNRVIHFQRNSDGSLVKTSCIANTTTSGCTTIPGVTSLNGPISLAISPDGKSIYVASLFGTSVTHLIRASTGTLTFGSCFSHLGVGGCSVATKNSLSGIKEVEVSPDGQSVYALSDGSDSVTWFNRTSTGVITYGDCISQGGVGGCTPVIAGLTTPGSMAVSPNDENVYVTSRDDDSIIRFARAAGGALTFGSCNANTLLVPGCAIETHGSLLGANGIAISPNGKSVYTIGTDSKTITTWKVGSNGILSFSGCFQNSGGLGCTAPASPAINLPLKLAVSEDGRSVYVTDNSGLATFVRGADGALSFAGCFTSAAAAGCTSTPSLKEVKSAFVSADGENVYLAAQQTSSLSIFNRDDYVAPTPPTALPPVPNTLKVKGPKKTIRTRTAVFKFSSTVPGSTFTCKLDRKKTKACKSGMKLKKLKLGKHKLLVTAVSPLGMIDPTPLRFTFTVKKKKKGRK